jgi:uncharacterized protein YlxW (UPF0749 family)
MNPFEMVVIIVVAVMIASVLRSRYQARGNSESNPAAEAENLRLREDVKQLKDRVRVLEQIVTDSGAQTAAQIEALREGNRISERDQA